MNSTPFSQDAQKAPLYEQIADKIEQRITTGEYVSGSRLPSEQQLCEELNVSRTILREAMKLLKERGLIDTRTGSGAYVTRPEAHNISDVVSRIMSFDRINYEDVFDVRTILEVESAALAAKYATNEEIEAMRSLLEELHDPSLTTEERAEMDFRFHYLIAKASKNPLLALLVEAMGGICRSVIEKTNLLPWSYNDSISRHALIFQAIEAHDTQSARLAAKEHLDGSKRSYKDYIAIKG